MVREGSPGAALFWDESYLWGVTAVHALYAAGLPFEIINTQQLCRGDLSRHRLIFVPGGWASKKACRLGESGQSAIREFVHRGGTYFGVCGGAGLALDAKAGLGLIPVSRLPRTRRVPSFAGPVSINLTDPDNPLWNAIQNSEAATSSSRTATVHTWWPSQFLVHDDRAIDVLATYHKPKPGATSSDLSVQDIEDQQLSWKHLEQEYGILLDPRRLQGEPAVISGTFGKGLVLLSMIHFDTPGDPTGLQVLKNLWAAQVGSDTRVKPAHESPQITSRSDLKQEPEILSLLQQAEYLIALGERLFLWRWRNQYLLCWRRGVRGLEFCTLFVMAREIAKECCRKPAWTETHRKALEDAAKSIKAFASPAAELLVKEALLMQRERINFHHCGDSEVSHLRAKLFSNEKSHGGAFKTLLDRLNTILFSLLRVKTDHH